MPLNRRSGLMEEFAAKMGEEAMETSGLQMQEGKSRGCRGFQASSRKKSPSQKHRNIFWLRIVPPRAD